MKNVFDGHDVQLKGKKILYKGFFKMEQYSFKHKLFSGGWSQEIKREVFERGDAVVVLPYDPITDQVVLIEQIRIPTMNKTSSPWLFELVAGMIEEGETTDTVATRELEEETGLISQKLEKIGEFFVSPGGSTELFHFYWAHIDASEAKGIHGLASENEDIKVHVIERKLAYNMLRDGKINNASTIIGLQWLQLNYSELV